LGVELILNLASRDFHKEDGVADHVGGAVLAFRNARHLLLVSK
jgi:hypothetical protein